MTRALPELRLALAILACAGVACFGKPASPTFPAGRPGTNSASAAVELKGRLAPLPGAPRGQMGFRTDAGAVYTLVSNRMSVALFIDTNLQSKSLLLKGLAPPGTQRFEVTGNLRSMRDGKVHELYYYCDICAIKGIDPGPCMCCREPVHLIEEPAKPDRSIQK